MKLKIKVTKEILERSMHCGLDKCEYATSYENCAIAVACQEIFPKCSVSGRKINSSFYGSIWSIPIPLSAQKFICDFDNCTPLVRKSMPEFEFEVELNDKVLAAINIEEAREALKNSTTLELIEV
jgi:hypothetical protein